MKLALPYLIPAIWTLCSAAEADTLVASRIFRLDEHMPRSYQGVGRIQRVLSHPTGLFLLVTVPYAGRALVLHIGVKGELERTIEPVTRVGTWWLYVEADGAVRLPDSRGDRSLLFRDGDALGELGPAPEWVAPFLRLGTAGVCEVTEGRRLGIDIHAAGTLWDGVSPTPVQFDSPEMKRIRDAGRQPLSGYTCDGRGGVYILLQPVPDAARRVVQKFTPTGALERTMWLEPVVVETTSKPRGRLSPTHLAVAGNQLFVFEQGDVGAMYRMW